MTPQPPTPAPSTELIAYDQALFPTLLDQDPEAVRLRIANRIMAAPTADAVFDVLEGNTSQKLVGKRLQITEVAWAPYASDRGIIPNAIVLAADVETGEVVEFATTSEMLTLSLRKWELIGAFPVNVRIAEVKTRSGQTALNFARP
jgi:hypothetical protein